MILDYSVEDTRWEPDRLRISIAFSGPCYTGEQQILGTTWWQRTFQNSSISARLTQVEIHLYGDIAPRGEPDFFDAYTSVIWQYRMQSLGSRIGAWDFLEEGARYQTEPHNERYRRRLCCSRRIPCPQRSKSCRARLMAKCKSHGRDRFWLKGAVTCVRVRRAPRTGGETVREIEGQSCRFRCVLRDRPGCQNG